MPTQTLSRQAIQDRLKSLVERSEDTTTDEHKEALAELLAKAWETRLRPAFEA